MRGESGYFSAVFLGYNIRVELEEVHYLEYFKLGFYVQRTDGVGRRSDQAT